jgi:predicted nuclease with TOPRIM domain
MMSIAQLWKAHFANPNNTVIRNAIATRDPGGARQLQPISRPCNVYESVRTIADLSSEVEELTDNRDRCDELLDENKELETEVEALEDKVEKLEEQLAAAIQ